jgi:hypothetical protein
MRLKLIAQWQSFWRMWSIRFTAIGTVLLTYLINSPDVIIQAWNILPAELKSVIPVDYTLYISIALLILGILSRVIKQEKLPNPEKDFKDGTS